MAGYGTAFGRGLILGAGAALVYAAARDANQTAARHPTTILTHERLTIAHA
jgi:hypothetical protein